MASKEESLSPSSPSSRKYLKFRSTPCSPKLPLLSPEMLQQALEKPENNNMSSTMNSSATPEKSKRESTFVRTSPTPSGTLLKGHLGQSPQSSKLPASVSYLGMYQKQAGRPKAKDGERDIRKAKTIFSMDTRCSRGQVESGLGDGGDGVKTGHQVMPADKVSSSVSLAKTNEEIAAHAEWYWNSKVRLSTVENLLGLPDLRESSSLVGVSTEEQRPRLKSLNGFIGILPESDSYPRSSSAPTGYDGTSMFNLILHRSSIKNGSEFRKSLRIHNMTQFLHAYKVCCNSSAHSKLEVIPAMGLIRPNEQISFEIRTKDAKSSLGMGYDPTRDKTEIKIFRYNCSDPDKHKQQKYYEELQAQCPDLISTQPIEKVLLWDLGNLSETVELLNSMDDDFDDDTDKLASLEADLIYYKLGQYPPPVTPLARPSSRSSFKAGLILAKNQLQTTNYNLLEASKTIRSLRHCQAWIFFAMVLYFMGPWLYSVLNDDRDNLLAKGEAVSGTWPTMMINIIGQNLFNLTKTDRN